MSPDQIKERILTHLRSDRYRPQRPRGLAKELQLQGEEQYHHFRDALRELMDHGRVVLGARGAIVLPGSHARRDEIVGTYSHNRRGFGFVVPSDPTGHEDLFIPQGENGGAISGDVVRARITSRGTRDGKALYTGRVMDVIEKWPDMASALAAGRLDLDDVSPEVAKELAAELALFIRKLQDS
jgi:ribonuclease R